MGLGVTSLVQSSAAAGPLVAFPVGPGLVATSATPAVMLGADMGIALKAVLPC